MSGLPLRLRLLRMSIRVRRSLSRRIWGHRTRYVGERLAEYKGYWSAAARTLGAEFEELTDEVWEARLGGRATRFNNHLVQIDDLVTMILAGDKSYGYRLARESGLPVPEHRLFGLETLDGAIAFVERGGPCVVKPARGSASGIGITLDVTDRRGLERAACLASLFSQDLIVERMIPGQSYRLLYLDGELLHAVRRRDEPAGRQAPELRTVYDEAVTGRLHPSIVAGGAAVSAALGSRFTGVDLITTDPGCPLADSGGVFLEINTTPGIHHHYIDTRAEDPQAVAVRILQRLLEPAADSRRVEAGDARARER